jgi:dihydrodipicolinate reductase
MSLETLYWRGSTRSEESPHTQRRSEICGEQLVLFLTTGRKLLPE